MSLCPNCGMQLTWRKFSDAFDADTKEPIEVNGDFYCENCKLRWISEQSQPLSKESIGYGEITIELPKQILELLRFVEKTDGDVPKDYIERCVLDGIRADIDADTLISNFNLIEKFQLKPLYRKVLGSW